MRGGVIELMDSLHSGVLVIADAARKPSVAEGRKVALAKSFRRQGGCTGTPGSKSKSLVIKEKECLVSPIVEMRDKDRTARRKTKVVLRVHRLGLANSVVFPTVGVQRAVAQKVINRRM